MSDDRPRVIPVTSGPGNIAVSIGDAYRTLRPLCRRPHEHVMLTFLVAMIDVLEDEVFPPGPQPVGAVLEQRRQLVALWMKQALRRAGSVERTYGS